MKYFKLLVKTPRRFFLFAAFIAALGLSGAVFLGYEIGARYPRTLVIKGVTSIDADAATTIDFSAFWEGWRLLKDDYLKGAEVKDQKLMYGAMDGLVKSLGDPNTNFFPPEDAKKFEQDVSGNFGGIGAEIGIKNEQLIVIAPLKDSPAEKIGLRAQDKILKIGDKITDDMRVDDAVKLIRGEIGTKVILTILRNGWEKSKEFTITRQAIQIPTLDYKMMESNIGYIRLRSFNENAPRLFFEASRDLLGKGVAGMVIDLRNNPGGFLEVAVNIAGWFFEKGTPVAIEEFRSDPKEVFRSSGNGAYRPVPIAVLINGGSASASEILAGALQDNLGSKLVGEKSFGKGTVQELKRLHDGSSIKLTIAHWLTPKGNLIDKNGIKPDYEVKLTDKDIEAEKDPQLDKALRVIKEQISKNVARN